MSKERALRPRGGKAASGVAEATCSSAEKRRGGGERRMQTDDALTTASASRVGGRDGGRTGPGRRRTISCIAPSE